MAACPKMIEEVRGSEVRKGGGRGGDAWEDVSHDFQPTALPRLATANRWFGGARVLLRPLSGLLDHNWEQPIRILDVGTGGGDIPRSLLAWARPRGLPLEIVGLEFNPAAAAHAASASRAFPEIRIVRGDAFHLPFPPKAFHVITCSMVLHYFQARQAAALLRAFAALEPRAILVTDLLRHWFPPLAMRCLFAVSRSGLFGPDARHTVSLGFTLAEVARLAGEAGFLNWRLLRSFPFRFCLLGFPARDR